jgi:hypothetical protein
VTVVFLGWLLGDPAGAGTVVYALLFDPAMQFGFKLFKVEPHRKTDSEVEVDNKCVNISSARSGRTLSATRAPYAASFSISIAPNASPPKKDGGVPLFFRYCIGGINTI